MNEWIEKFNNYWRIFAQNLKLSAEQSKQLYEVLIQAYTEPHRHYHTVQHIVECLDLYHQVKNQLEQPLWVQLAIWFHDVIYDPQSNENEMRSALLMQDLCEDFLDEDALATIFLWILATMYHQPTDQTDLNYLLDIDLAILGTSSARFLQYEQQVRLEYSWVPLEIYTVKRTEILHHFTCQKPLYKTLYFQQHFEKCAQVNLSV